MTESVSKAIQPLAPTRSAAASPAASHFAANCQAILHFALEGWGEFARLIQPIIERDFYGRVPAGVISPPNLGKASYSSAAQDDIVLGFDQPVLWHEGLAMQFYPDDEGGLATSGHASGSV